jgi:hypothetical protein
MSDCWGELDEWFASSKSIPENPSKSKTDDITKIPSIAIDDRVLNSVMEKCITDKDDGDAGSHQKNQQEISNPRHYLGTKKHMKSKAYQREKARIQAKKSRATRKAEFLALLEYSTSLEKQNKKLKKEICLLKEQLKELLAFCQQKHQM